MSIVSIPIEPKTSAYRDYNTVSIDPIDLDFIRTIPSRRRRQNHFVTAASDDPMVVSDDQIARRARITNANILGDLHSYFIANLPSHPETPSVLEHLWRVSERAPTIAQKWRNYMGLLTLPSVDRSLSRLLEAPTSRSSSNNLFELIKRHLIVDPIGSQQILIEVGIKSLASEYQAIIDDHLGPLGYEAQEIYADSLGGFLSDFLRDRDRVTCAVTKSTIQIIYSKDSTIYSQLFEQNSNSKLEVAEFIENNIS